MSQQKVAIVTGGSLGIGAAIVRRLSHDGYAVTLDYHTHSDAANAIAQEISGQGGQALVVQADVSSVRDIANLVTQTVTRFGGSICW